MQNAQLTLLIPELPIQYQQMPALDLLISRSAVKTLPISSWEAYLCWQFGIVMDELPIAALTGLADGLATHTGFWLRADPVQLQIDLATVYLIGNAALRLTKPEILFLKQEINNFLKEEQITLFTPTAKRWYLKLVQLPQVYTSILDKVIGKSITNFLPRGEQQEYWQKLLTELQMLLHSSSVNQARAQQGLATINSVWLWGGGALPAVAAVPWQQLWTDDILLKGLAQIAKILTKTTPASLDKIIDQLNASQRTAVSLSYSDNLSVEQWLNQLEENWFKPVVAALKKGRLKNLNLYLGNDKLLQINRKSVWYFWRR